MTKRTIEVQCKGQVKTKSYKKTITYDVPVFRLRQVYLETEIGYFDVTLTLDRKGRLDAVMIEPTRGLK